MFFMQMFQRKRWRWLPLLVLALLLTTLHASTVLAAEFASDEIYRLPANETIEDDLYVAGREIYINGTVRGDVVAAGSYVEVSGTVEGDLIAAGALIIVSGEVQDDARLAGAEVRIDGSGSIGDDLIASAGGGGSFQLNEVHDVDQGLTIADGARIGGEAILFGGEGEIRGTIEQGVNAFMGSMLLAAEVSGDVELAGDGIIVDDDASVAGTLTYTSREQIDVPEGVATDVVYEEPERDPQKQRSPVQHIVGWLVRTLLMLVGFGLLGWLILRLAPGLITYPAQAIDQRPTRAGISGLLLSLLLIFFPLLSALLVALMVLFGGWFPGIVLGLFLFGTLALLWFLSPLISGLWLGEKLRARFNLQQGDMLALALGVLVVVLLSRVPLLGWFVSLVSFIFAMGGLLVALRPAPSPAVE